MQENSGAAEITRENEVKAGVKEVEENEEEENNNISNNNNNNNSVGETTSAEFCRNLGGNRWPEQETMALIEIRSALDVAFRDSAAKSPLWEEISRRMAALGYRRSAHKCREKFENIYKYHKRLKNGSSARPTAKTYRFFNYLEALDHHQIALKSASSEQTGNTMKHTTIDAIPISSNPPYVPQMAIPISINFDSSPITTSSSTPSSSESQSETTRKRKRKWADLFDKLMKSVLAKQEELQNKFLEAIDKFEQERLAREVEWKKQEIERIKKQHDLLIHERSISAAKDAAVLAFLQKISEQGNFPGLLGEMDEFLRSEPSIVAKKEKDDGENSNSRWPKEEVEALIRIKTSMELQNQRMGPLWEDISMGMKSVGYDRNAKKCKEKWENINKYYRRVKDSHRQRPVDSKTCPYFHLLDSLYGMKTRRVLDHDCENSGSSSRPEELLMHMMNVAPSQNGIQKIEDHNNEAEGGNEDANDGDDYESVPNVRSPTRV
ncbi:hypothetical protein KSS87_013431 [Heliosperma pusillum]|nr:hypothetical protein KSS87_013431 [Heliosperma pusillum]